MTADTMDARVEAIATLTETGEVVVDADQRVRLTAIFDALVPAPFGALKSISVYAASDAVAQAPLDGNGYVFLNPDSGMEWSKNHPVESGEVPDAEDIRHATDFEDGLGQKIRGAEASREESAQDFSQAYYLVKGQSPKWSPTFGAQEALSDIKDAVEALKSAVRPAVARAPQQPVAIRPLVWKEFTGSVTWAAETVFGAWLIKVEGEFWLQFEGSAFGRGEPFPGLEAAKEIARDDFEARIRSAFTASPPREEDVQRLVAAAPMELTEAEAAIWSRGFEAGEDAALAEAHKNGAFAEAIAAARREALEELLRPRPAEEYHEDMGNVLWWHYPVQEAPWVGTTNDTDFNAEWHQWWAPLPDGGGKITEAAIRALIQSQPLREGE